MWVAPVRSTLGGMARGGRGGVCHNIFTCEAHSTLIKAREEASRSQWDLVPFTWSHVVSRHGNNIRQW
jgi:hypothetical protein